MVKSDFQKKISYCVFCDGEFNKVKRKLLGKDPFLLPMKQLIYSNYHPRDDSDDSDTRIELIETNKTHTQSKSSI